MPGRIKAAYDSIPHEEVEVVSRSVALRNALKDWSLQIVTVAIILLLIAIYVLTKAIWGLNADIHESLDQQAEAKVRGCVILAQAGGYFPPSCLDSDVLPVYSHDLIDTLSPSGGQGQVRKNPCKALASSGNPDSDC